MTVYEVAKKVLQDIIDIEKRNLSIGSGYDNLIDRTAISGMELLEQAHGYEESDKLSEKK